MKMTSLHDTVTEEPQLFLIYNYIQLSKITLCKKTCNAATDL